jgi:transposase-like protein
MTEADGIDERTAGLIASRVARALREELAAVVAELRDGSDSDPLLTVVDVAERLGVARSTVYTHWREWGGYKLGDGQKTAIRFRASALPSRAYAPSTRSGNGARQATSQRRSQPRRRQLLRGTPGSQSTWAMKADAATSRRRAQETAPH